jgi:hypothetical protein
VYVCESFNGLGIMAQIDYVCSRTGFLNLICQTKKMFPAFHIEICIHVVLPHLIIITNLLYLRSVKQYVVS